MPNAAAFLRCEIRLIGSLTSFDFEPAFLFSNKIYFDFFFILSLFIAFRIPIAQCRFGICLAKTRLIRQFWQKYSNDIFFLFQKILYRNPIKYFLIDFIWRRFNHYQFDCAPYKSKPKSIMWHIKWLKFGSVVISFGCSHAMSFNTHSHINNPMLIVLGLNFFFNVYNTHSSNNANRWEKIQQHIHIKSKCTALVLDLFHSCLSAQSKESRGAIVCVWFGVCEKESESRKNSD